MNLDEFLERLDKKNHGAEELGDMVTIYDKHNPITFVRKGKDLFEVVTNHLNQRLFPLVDKRLGVVFGVERCLHKGLRCELFRYHNVPNNPNRDWINPNECADRWVSEGMGWYVSSMDEKMIIAGQKYRPDRFDKDCFQLFTVDFTI